MLIDAYLLDQREDNPPGIIMPNDATAFGVMRAMLETGRLPGRDFGLVGFDDYPPSRNLGLTTLRPPLEELGEAAARMLMRALRGEALHLQTRLRSHLIKRATTNHAQAPPPQQQ